MKRIAGNLALLIGSVLFALLACELISRWLFPISPGAKKVTADGEVVTEWLEPGLSYYQSSTEYHALTTITENGHRSPDVSDPQIIFLGDSFTFGQGLADHETFVHIYARTLNLPCANLGVPGSGTRGQVDRLEFYLKNEGWRPRQVKLFFMGMTTSLLAGNDLADNLFDARLDQWAAEVEVSDALPQRENMSGGWVSGLLSYRKKMLQHSNLLRVTKFYFGPAIKKRMNPQSDKLSLAHALDVTHAQFERLHALSDLYGFEYEIYVLHPVQDITMDTHAETLTELQRLAPPHVFGTAAALVDDPESYYYPYDGHLNAKGAGAIAKWLVARDRERTREIDLRGDLPHKRPLDASVADS